MTGQITLCLTVLYREPTMKEINWDRLKRKLPDELLKALSNLAKLSRTMRRSKRKLITGYQRLRSKCLVTLKHLKLKRRVAKGSILQSNRTIANCKVQEHLQEIRIRSTLSRDNPQSEIQLSRLTSRAKTVFVRRTFRLKGHRRASHHQWKMHLMAHRNEQHQTTIDVADQSHLSVVH